MRCQDVEKQEVPMPDGKMHIIYICRNKESENYKNYTVDKCAVCSNCLKHRGA